MVGMTMPYPVASTCSRAERIFSYSRLAFASEDVYKRQPEPAEMAAECRAVPEPPEAETEAAPYACCCRHKVRTPEEHKALLNRLSRIEGQIRGIRGMVEKDVYCADILVQVAAANSCLLYTSRCV